MEKIRVSKLVTTFGFGAAAWVVTAVIALSWGAVNDPSFEVIRQVRLPRAILASAIGVGLSVAGAALQALFANPLCEPYTLGISSGAGLGAVLGISFGFQWMVAGLTGTAFLGAIVFSVVLYLISLKAKGGNTTLLLAGVMLGFLGSSLVTLWISLSDSNGVQNAMNWLFGDLSRARLGGSLFTVAGVLSLTALLWGEWRNLDGLLMGEEGAAALGVDVRQVRRKVIVLVSLLIGLCVSAGGMIGFIGLVVPHFSRRMIGSLHLRLIPLCAIWGAATLTLADCLARVVVRPYELPVGVVTALIGAPVFLWIMLKRQERES